MLGKYIIVCMLNTGLFFQTVRVIATAAGAQREQVFVV
jgi:hypothetical protein